jgi:putative phosphoesterase
VKIGIVSDTHNETGRTGRAVGKLAALGAQVFIHCGDLTSSSIVHLFEGRPAYFVLGNCDEDERAIRAAIEAISGHFLGHGGVIELDGRSIAVTHGHLDRERSRLLRLSPNYLFSGHSHVSDDHREGVSRLINPGALHRAARWTVATLDLISDTLEYVEVK